VGFVAFAAMSCFAWGVPTSARASLPLIATDGASATGATTARVSGNADPEGQSTTLHADYALASEPWCTSHGAEGTLAETAPQDLGSGNAMYSEILVGLEGLTPASEYCAELVASNESGTTYGGQVRFTLKLPASPSIESESVSNITPTNATLEAQINPGGLQTTYEVWAGTLSCMEENLGAVCESTGEGKIVGTIPAGSSAQKVSVDIVKAWHNLSPNSSYIYSFRATNSDGTAYGNGNKEFKTLAASPPSIDSESVSHLTPTDATLEAQINTEGLETTYEFLLVGSACRLCLSPAYLLPLPSGKLLGSFIDQSVSIDLNSAGVTLAPYGYYEYSVTATSAAGTTQGPPQAFTKPKGVVYPPNTTMSPGPQAATGPAQNIGQGTVMPAATELVGNITPSPKTRALTNAQKLAKAVRACKRKPRKQRVRCEKLAHKKSDRTSASKARKR
jgi:hypothetical protein